MNKKMIKNIKALKNNHNNDYCFDYYVKSEILDHVKWLNKSGTMVYANETLMRSKDIFEVAVNACALNWWGWVLHEEGDDEKAQMFWDAYNYISNFIYFNASKDCACDYHTYLD